MENILDQIRKRIALDHKANFEVYSIVGVLALFLVGYFLLHLEVTGWTNVPLVVLIFTVPGLMIWTRKNSPPLQENTFEDVQNLIRDFTKGESEVVQHLVLTALISKVEAKTASSVDSKLMDLLVSFASIAILFRITGKNPSDNDVVNPLIAFVIFANGSLFVQWVFQKKLQWSFVLGALRAFQNKSRVIGPRVNSK